MKRRGVSLLWHLPLALLAFTFLLPLFFMIGTALSRPEEAMQADAPVLRMFVPRHPNVESFFEVWRVVPFLRYYFNSLALALTVTTGQVFTSACAAFAFARLRWPGRDRLFILYLATIMVPSSVTMLPNFIIMKMLPVALGHLFPHVDWLALRYAGTSPDATPVGRIIGFDSYLSLMLPGMFSAYGTFLLRQFFLTLPRELDEAAKIDGCGYWRIFLNVILPLSLPGLATLSIFTFMGNWGALLWPLVMTNQGYMSTLPVGLQAFQGSYGTEWNLMMAAALLMLLPVLAIFLVGQRFFVSGLTVGAVKG